MPFVLDASVAACWLFEDEDHPDAAEAFARVRTDNARVPSLWWFKVRNTLLVNERRGRLAENDTTACLPPSRAWRTPATAHPAKTSLRLRAVCASPCAVCRAARGAPLLAGLPRKRCYGGLPLREERPGCRLARTMPATRRQRGMRRLWPRARQRHGTLRSHPLAPHPATAAPLMRATIGKPGPRPGQRWHDVGRRRKPAGFPAGGRRGQSSGFQITAKTSGSSWPAARPRLA